MRAIQDQFYGDNPRWFIGVVEDNANDPEMLGRVRVRCFGIHSPYISDIAVTDLPWATVLIPPTGGGISGLGNSPTGLENGAFVFGIFLDGKHSQMPFVLGTFSKYETGTGENIIPYKIDIPTDGSSSSSTPSSAPPAPTIQDQYNNDASQLTPEQQAAAQVAATENSEQVMKNAEAIKSKADNTKGGKSGVYTDANGNPVYNSSPPADIANNNREAAEAIAYATGDAGVSNVVSGYRSPEYNAILGQNGYGVASNSMHLQNRAIDFYTPLPDGQVLQNLINYRATVNPRIRWKYYGTPGQNNGFWHVDNGGSPGSGGNGYTSWSS